MTDYKDLNSFLDEYDEDDEDYDSYTNNYIDYEYEMAFGSPDEGECDVVTDDAPNDQESDPEEGEISPSARSPEDYRIQKDDHEEVGIHANRVWWRQYNVEQNHRVYDDTKEPYFFPSYRAHKHTHKAVPQSIENWSLSGKDEYESPEYPLNASLFDMSANIKRSELQILHMILGTGYSSKTKAITTEAKRTVRISKKALKLFLGTNARALRKSVYALRDLEPVICATGIVNGREPEKLRFFERIEEDHLHYYFTMTHKLQNELFYPRVYIHVDLFSVGQLKSLYALGILPFMLFRSRLPRHVSEFDLDQLAELMQAKKEYGQHMPRSKVLERFETARQHIYDEVMSVHVSIDEIDPKKKDRISLRVKPGQRRHFHKAKPGNARLMFRFKASEKMFVDANRFINLAQDLGFELGQDTARAVFQNWVMFLHEDEEACSAADFSRFEKHVWNNRGLKKVDPKEFEIAVRETWNPLNNNRFKETGKRFSGQDRAAMTQRPDGTIDPDSISIQPPDFLDEYII